MEQSPQCINSVTTLQDESRKTRRKQLVEKQLAENSPAEDSYQVQKIIPGKYSANFVIILCYEVLNYFKVLNCKL